MALENSFYVPTINVRPYLINPGSVAAERVINEVRQACISTGFFQIIGHGLDTTLQKQLFNAAENFFRLPLEEKKKLDSKQNVGYRGYDVLASQSYEVGVEPDLKEGYYIGTEIAPSNPLHGRFFSGPNVWPSPSLLSISDFRTPCEEYYEEVHALALKILELVGVTLARDEASNSNSDGNKTYRTNIPSVIEDISTSSPFPACPLRLLHYPSATHGSATGNPQYGASAHTDFGAITLLLQDDNPGLEVLDVEKNVWMPIDPNPDAYVVNIGDILSMVTNNKYKSSVHRVVCKRPEKERYSIVFFWDGCLDAELKPINTDEESVNREKKRMTVEQHMIERLTMSYGKAKKDPRREGQGNYN